MTAEALLTELVDLVPFLRWRIGPFAPDELPAAMLAASPDELAVAVAATAEGRGAGDPQVAASLWWQSYAYRVAGTTLGCWLVAGAAPDPAAAGMAVTTARSRPSSVVWTPEVAVVDDLDRLVTRLFAEHLDPVAASLRTRYALGMSLVRGNIAAGIESAIAAVVGAEGAPDLRAGITRVRAALPAEVTATIDLVDDGYRRRACCLWWKSGEGAGRLCSDCSLDARPHD